MINAKSKDKKRVISVLSNSLANNNWVNQLVKQDYHRFRRIEKLVGHLFEHCMQAGKVAISEDRSACALVFFRDQKKPGLRLFCRFLMLAFKVIGVHGLSEILKIERYIRIAQNAVAGKNQIYHIRLWGVYSNFQRRGAGTKLFLELLEESRVLGRMVFLETSDEEMIPFYEKVGLSIYHQIDLDETIYMLKQNS